MHCIAYKAGYEYQLQRPYVDTIPIYPSASIATPFVGLRANGGLSIRAGYAWDGPSGPTIDTNSFMRGSLVHDALYQLMRIGLLDPAKHRESADKILRRYCLTDGMSRIRAAWVYHGVRLGGRYAVRPQSGRVVIYAPEA